MKLLICGGGNGAHALAGLAAADPNTEETRVLTLFQDEAERWTNCMKQGDFIVSFHEHGKEVRRLQSKPTIVSKDPKVAEGCDMIVLVVPAFGHPQYLKEIKPFITPGTTIVGMPGQAGFEFDVFGIVGDIAKECTLLSFETLPWACRIKTYGVEVEVLGTKGTITGAIKEANVKPRVDPVQSMQGVLGAHPVLNVKGHILGMTLMGVNAYGHSAILYGKWKDYKEGQSYESAPLFYQGVDDLSADVMSSMSDEILLIAEALRKQFPDVDLSNVIHIKEFMLKSYFEEIQDKSCLRTCFSSNEAYVGLTHPMASVDPDGQRLKPDFKHRYFTEDIPYGLVVLRGVAEVVGVATPVMDMVLEWCQKMMGKEYLVDGKIRGKDVAFSRAPQRYGLNTMAAILGK